ncbi:hypothetical protein BJV78DRAFT_153238 [Lactifluus subvellereus]|nr:hypothetical protein BJV78DRAFT_153238 [Lactifluus subvellereus]
MSQFHWRSGVICSSWGIATDHLRNFVAYAITELDITKRVVVYEKISRNSWIKGSASTYDSLPIRPWKEHPALPRSPESSVIKPSQCAGVRLKRIERIASIATCPLLIMTRGTGVADREYPSLLSKGISFLYSAVLNIARVGLNFRGHKTYRGSQK